MIPYFAVGAASVAVRLLAGRNYLVSFAYIGSNFCTDSEAEALRRGCARGFLDSGAFTAWKQGKPVDLGAYIEYVRRFGTDYTSIAALDDITSPETSLRNWRRMLAELPGLATRIVPVWHEGEPIDVLDEYVAGAPIVGIGRTAGRRSKDKTLVLYDDVFNRWPAGSFHAFGNGDPVTLEPPTTNVYGGRSRKAFAAHADEDGKETVATWRCADDCPVRKIDEQSIAAGIHGAGCARADAVGGTYDGSTGIGFATGGSGIGVGLRGFRYGDAGGASRFFHTTEWDETLDVGPFFYCAKASTSERNGGLSYRHSQRLNTHPTVKPLALMRHLVRLVTPPNGLVLDPFAGSGTTLVAAVYEGLRAIGIEQEPSHEGADDYISLIGARIDAARAEVEIRDAQQNLFDITGATP